MIKLTPTLPTVLLIAIMIFEPTFIIEGVTERSWGKEVLLNKSGYGIFTLYFASYVLIGFVTILIEFLRSKGARKLYLKLVFIGLIIAFGMGTTFNLILPALGNYQYIWLGPLFTLAYVISISYAIIKHRLFDVGLLVARSAAYILSTATLAVVYVIVAFSIIGGVVFKTDDISFTTRLVYTFLAIVTAIVYQPVRSVFDKISNRLFYQDSYETQALLDDLNKVLVSDVEINSLLSKTASLIEQNLKVTYCSFYIRETSYVSSRVVASEKQNISQTDLEKIHQVSPRIKYRIYHINQETSNNEEAMLNQLMQDNGIEIIGRLVSTLKYEVAGVGYLILGSKQSGAVYSDQDMKVLEIITNELVLAVENVLRYEEIEKFNETLQKKIDDATKELRKNNEKLKALDEAKDEFVSMASHQLRTPLTTIKGYLSMVLEGDAGDITPTQKDMLGQALFSSQRMVYLISDLLNVSRLKTGKFLIEPKNIYLPDVIETEIDQLRDGAKSKELTIEYIKPDSFSHVMLDEMKIRQVIMNFTDNAIYYTKPGGTITVGLKETSKSIEFTVTDDGIGVPKEQQHKLFAKFYRAENARKARPDGTGLGLFMAKKVIIAQEGSIVFKSKEGKGSTFGFSFPKDKILAQEPS